MESAAAQQAFKVQDKSKVIFNFPKSSWSNQARREFVARSIHQVNERAIQVFVERILQHVANWPGHNDGSLKVPLHE